MMRWAEIVLEIHSESAEAAIAIFLEAGCQGVREAGVEPRVLTGFMPVSDDLSVRIDALEDRLADLPTFGLSAPTDITLKYADDRDWANEWKKHFKPVEIGKRIVIKPTWEEYTGDPSRVVVELDPGMAFGTGGHPTTRLCLASLEDYVHAGDTIADIGTGSGILSIAAARLGATRVHATDIDSLPRKIARENVALNGLDGVITIHEPDAFDAAAHDCDLVVANIIAMTIIELAPSVHARLRPGGTFISSGIVEERYPDVVQALEGLGFRLIETREEDIWRCIVARRDP